MGMCAYFAAVDNEQIARFSQDPDQVSTFLYPVDPAAGPAHTVDIDKACPEADLDYVLHSYLRLARFYADAAQRGDGALLYIS